MKLEKKRLHGIEARKTIEAKLKERRTQIVMEVIVSV